MTEESSRPSKESSSRPIVVTGAGGKTGLAVLRALRRVRASSRALIRRPAQAASVREAGAGEIVTGDLLDPATAREAVRGAGRIYHISPNMHAQEALIGRQMLSAAESSPTLERFVFHSVLHPQTKDMPHHWRKLQVEEMILKSRLPFAILRPAAYLQNLVPYWHQAQDDGEMSIPFSADTAIAMVDLEDVATVAAKVLTEPGHEAAVYDLCGQPAIDHRQVGEAMSRALGRPVAISQEALESWRRRAESHGLDERRIEELCSMFRYYERYGLPGHPGVLGWLLGRRPTDLDPFLRRLAGECSDA